MSLVAIATCAGEAVDEHDSSLLTAALATRGIDARLVAWDAPGIDWDDHDLVVVRSTWDYTERLEEFVAWARSVPRLANPAEVLAWNTDKHYLADLAAAGVPVVPTTFASCVDDLVVPEAEQFVIKPTVGAGSMGAARFAADDLEAAATHLASLVDRGAVAMVQPYLDQVEVDDETGIVVIDGVVSHAIAKGAMLVVDEMDRSGLFRAEAISPRTPSTEELHVAEAALAAALAHLGMPGPLLYARVDLLPSPDGPVLIELELTEPSLFFEMAPLSADLLAMAIEARITER